MQTHCHFWETLHYTRLWVDLPQMLLLLVSRGVIGSRRFYREECYN